MYLSTLGVRVTIIATTRSYNAYDSVLSIMNTEQERGHEPLPIRNRLTTSQLFSRLQKHAREWGVDVERKSETETSVIAFGSRDHKPVVLKVVKQRGDEWGSGEVLETFDGHGVVRVYEHGPGAVLMERLRPGTSLVSLSLNGRDEEATDILADVIQQMTGREIASHPTSETRQPAPETFAAVQDWAKGFDRYLASGDGQITRKLVETAQEAYLKLAESQRQPRLLHGDLQHYNVLFDSDRGWVAIDPKGVIGEVEYEIGAAMRNPIERPDLFLSLATIERRLQQFTNRLDLNLERAMDWTFAQAVLSAIWDIEDGFEVDAANPSLRLAHAILPMLARQSRF
jgi:streptomycin 6-kinase